MYEDCKRLGVRFIFGNRGGAAKAVIMSDSGSAVGILSEDGTRHNAGTLILACGAWLDSIFDTEGQILAKWYVGI